MKSCAPMSSACTAIRFVRFDTGSAHDAMHASGLERVRDRIDGETPREAHVQRGEEHDRGVEVERRDDDASEDPATDRDAPPGDNAGRGVEHAEVVEQRGERDREEQERERFDETVDRPARDRSADRVRHEREERGGYRNGRERVPPGCGQCADHAGCEERDDQRGPHE